MKKTPSISAEQISKEILDAIADITNTPDAQERGVVMSMSDGIAWIWGLASFGFHEMIEIDTDDGLTIRAFALNIEEDQIGAVVLGDEKRVKAGSFCCI